MKIFSQPPPQDINLQALLIPFSIFFIIGILVNQVYLILIYGPELSYFSVLTVLSNYAPPPRPLYLMNICWIYVIFHLEIARVMTTPMQVLYSVIGSWANNIYETIMNLRFSDDTYSGAKQK